MPLLALKIFPSFFVNNTTYLRLIYIKHHRNFGLRKSIALKILNFENVFFGQLVNWIFLSATKYCIFAKPISVANHQKFSAFFYHVFGVFGITSQKQMVGTNANRIIAFVKNEQVNGNFSVVNLPRKSVGRFPFSVSNRERSISTTKSARRHPFPAVSKFRTMFRNRAVFVHFLPKAFFHGLETLNIGIIFFRTVFSHAITMPYMRHKNNQKMGDLRHF